KEAWATVGVSANGASMIVGAQYFENTALGTLDRRLSTLSITDLAGIGQNPSVLPSYFSLSFAGRNGNFVISGSPLAQGAPGYNANIKTLPPKTNPNAPAQTTAQLVAAGYYVPITDTTLSKQALGATNIINTSLYDNALILPNQRNQAFASGEKE